MSNKSEMSRTIDTIISIEAQPYLIAQGFRKIGRTFFRQKQDVYQIISIQSSQRNHPGYARFTINLEITSRDFHELYMSTPFPKNPGSARKFVEKRIGQLIPRQLDYWWEISTETNEVEIHNIAHNITQDISQYGLPFLEKFSCLDDSLNIFAETDNSIVGYKPDTICYAVLLCLKGETAKAKATLVRLKEINEHAGYLQHVLSIERKLGLIDHEAALVEAKRLQDLEPRQRTNEYMVEKMGGLTEEECAWAGCNEKRINGTALCPKHYFRKL